MAWRGGGQLQDMGPLVSLEVADPPCPHRRPAECDGGQPCVGCVPRFAAPLPAGA